MCEREREKNEFTFKNIVLKITIRSLVFFDHFELNQMPSCSVVEKLNLFFCRNFRPRILREPIIK